MGAREGIGPETWRARLGLALRAIPALSGAQTGKVLSESARRLVVQGRLGGDEVVFSFDLGTGHAARIARAADGLRHFHAALGPEGPYRVPRPISHWPAHRLAVSSLARGASLESLLATAERDTRSALLARAGGWLAAATAGHRRDEAFGGRFWVRRLGAEAERIADPAARLLAQALAGRLADFAQRCDGRITARAPAHGDFRAHNLLFDPADGTLTALDFTHWEVRPLAREVATFLIDLNRREPGADPKADRAALLAGAALPPGEAETVLPFFETREVLHAFLQAAERGTTQGSRIEAQARARLDLG